METKLAKLKQMMADGDHRGALKLAASWPRLGPNKERIQKGWAALINPRFYEEIGFDPKLLILDGICAIKEQYGIA